MKLVVVWEAVECVDTRRVRKSEAFERRMLAMEAMDSLGKEGVTGGKGKQRLGEEAGKTKKASSVLVRRLV